MKHNSKDYKSHLSHQLVQEWKSGRDGWIKLC